MQNNSAWIDSDTWVNSAAYCLSLNIRTITLNNTEYTLFWTLHAAHRAEYRKCTGTVVLNAFIKDFLNDLTKADKLKEINGYISIRDFKTGVFVVMHIDNVKKRIAIITCGDVMNTTPQNGDIVIQRNKDGVLSCYTWRRPHYTAIAN